MRTCSTCPRPIAADSCRGSRAVEDRNSEGVIAYIIDASTTRPGIANSLALLRTSSSHPLLVSNSSGLSVSRYDRGKYLVFPKVCAIMILTFRYQNFRSKLRPSACPSVRYVDTRAVHSKRRVLLRCNFHVTVLDYCAEIPWKIITESNLELHRQGTISATQNTKSEGPRCSLSGG
ncbi:hypothetical protein EDD18DRAFT_1196423 [Armillaria luteobubalina]|uniref:Uncharacterized protein n=1 Tax=Armillaria luteobubalina TaxID=153913 RepID=A0AA39PKL5_9AGAR|nr:hypothetical protein EDD18DRAFT_1196423 [Armillaria luteobubalina]